MSLTIFLLSRWLQTHYPHVDWFSHDARHLLEMRLANPHVGPFHVLSFIFGGDGFILISAGWKALYGAQQNHALATTGSYAYVCHPQYLGFMLVMFLQQWPTILTLAMFPVPDRRLAERSTAVRRVEAVSRKQDPAQTCRI